MVVTDVLLSGRVITPTFELERTALRLPLTPTLGVGEAITLAMDFVVDVPTTGYTGHGLFAYRRGVMALPNVYPLIPVYDDEGWNVDLAPAHADDVYADVAAYDVQITAPATLRLVASGTCESQRVGEDKTTWTCEAAPMRDFVLILGENFQYSNRVARGVVINSYFYTGHEAGGEKALQVAVDALNAFTELFGPYPYTELDVVETPNYLGGMEYPGLVVVEDNLYPGVVGVEWLTAHEVAHQWWFALVGSDQLDEPWLDEALTQYSTSLYYEQVYGAERAENIRYSEFKQVRQNLIRRGRDLPIGLEAQEYPAELYWEVVYDKGALYFHTLREEVGDEAFFDILRTYYRRHRYDIATPQSFLAVVESVTGDSHRDLFDEWVRGETAE
jgi:aminopeptidase N